MRPKPPYWFIVDLFMTTLAIFVVSAGAVALFEIVYAYFTYGYNNLRGKILRQEMPGR